MLHGPNRGIILFGPLPSLLQPQYIFLHDALLEAIECEVTEVAARDLRDLYRRLGIMDDPKGKTDLQIEFEKLDTTIHRKIHRNTALLPVNKLKNRYANQDMVPCELLAIELIGHVTT